MNTFTTRIYVIRSATGQYLKFYDEAANENLEPGETPQMAWTPDLNDAKLFSSPAEIKSWVASHKWFNDRSYSKMPTVKMIGIPVEIECSKITNIAGQEY